MFFRDLRKELGRVREEVGASIRNDNPSIEIRSAMIMATTWLGVIETRIRKTRNLQERRKLIHEFQSRTKTIDKVLRMLRGAGAKDNPLAQQELRRVLP